MSTHIAAAPRSNLTLRTVGCAFVAICAVILLVVIVTVIQWTAGRNEPDAPTVPAWVQQGIDLQQCPINERVTAVELAPGLWKVDCVEG